MKTSILKYIVLLSALLISVYVLVKKYSFTYNMLFIVSGLLILYVIIQTLEQIKNKKEKKMPANGFLYYTPGVITKKVIKIGAFIIAATVLLYSDNKVLLFGLVLAGIILADIISLIMELKNNRYFVYFDDKAIVVTFE